LSNIANIGCRGTALAALLAAALHVVPASAQQLPHDVLYVQSNVVAGNSVIGYARAADGTLTPLPGSPYPTGGIGFYDPSYKLGPFDTDQNLVADPDLGVLYTPNPGSNTIAALRFQRDGSLRPLFGSPFPAFGSNPLSVAVNGFHLIIVNGDENPSAPTPSATPSFRGDPIFGDGQIFPVPGGAFPVPVGAAPGQALTTNTHGFVFTQEFLGGTVRSFAQLPLGQLVELDSTQVPIDSAAETAQPLPLGMWTNPKLPLFYVGLTNVSRIGVFGWSPLGKLSFLGSVGETGAAPCWIRVNAAGTRLYAVNTGSHSIGVFDLSNPEQPVEIQEAPVATVAGGLFQFGLSPDGQFVYVIEAESSAAAVGKSNYIHLLDVDPTDGTLTENPAGLTKLPVPPLTRSEGVLVF
jgi:hypothetical protein